MKEAESETRKIFEQSRLFAQEANQIIVEKFKCDFTSNNKADNSIVTEVDLAVEEHLRNRITEVFPAHGIIGEEGDSYNSGASFTWILDPIDGTQSFFHRVPTFGSLIAVNRDSENIVGLISHPILNEVFSAAKGLGCYLNNKSIQISDKESDSIDHNEIITLCSRKQWEISSQQQVFDSLWHKHSFFRIYYDCFALSRAVAGQIGCAVEMNVNLWDLAPCKVMIEEAGGLYIDLGNRVLPNGKHAYSALMGKPSVTKIMHDWLSHSFI